MKRNSRTDFICRAACLLLLLASTSATVSPTATAAPSDYAPPQKMRIPQNNQITPERVALGKALFFDPRLSGKNHMSCASCHNPSLAWTDGLAVAIGSNAKTMNRATPTILNVGYGRKFFWDGRANSLEEQSVGPIKSATEMDQKMDDLIAELRSIKGYATMFEKAYPGEGISEKTIGKALASFQRTIVSNYDTPFDRWIAGDQNAISDAAKNGFKLFDGKARCSVCHSGHNFTDGSFHNIGLTNDNDAGRYEFVKVKVMKGAFKTPTLRNVTRTAPYMHNGELKTMEEVIDHYIEGGKDKSNLSPDMQAIKLTQREKTDLIEFLETLKENSQPVTVPILPN